VINLPRKGGIVSGGKRKPTLTPLGNAIRCSGVTQLNPPAADEEVQNELPDKSQAWSAFVFDPTAEIPPEQPIFEGLIAKGDLAVWLGREKHRKSNVLLQFAICAALGRPFLDFRFCPPEPLRVVVLDYESKSQTIKTRLAAITTAMRLSSSDRDLLNTNLRIVEMRKALRRGKKFARFPVKPERGQDGKYEFQQAEEDWHDFVQECAADLYIIDPMRCMHSEAENDSGLETLITRIHQFFGDASVVISHHLRKRNRKTSDQPKLKDDIRVWADEARGSGAINAHADAVIGQERREEKGLELLDLGAFLRDGADINPIVLRETGHETFFWEVELDISTELLRCLDALEKAPEKFRERAAAVKYLEQKLKIGRTTSYYRIRDLINVGLFSFDSDTPACPPVLQTPPSTATTAPTPVSMNPETFTSDED